MNTQTSFSVAIQGPQLTIKTACFPGNENRQAGPWPQEGHFPAGDVTARPEAHVRPQKPPRNFFTGISKQSSVCPRSERNRHLRI